MTQQDSSISTRATNGATSMNGTTGLARVDPEHVAKLGMAAYRAPSLLQPHRAQEALRDAHDGRIPPLIGFFCGLSCPPVAKVVAQLGFDIVWIDWEHASTNVETMTQVSPEEAWKIEMLNYLHANRWYTTSNSSAKAKAWLSFGTYRKPSNHGF